MSLTMPDRKHEDKSRFRIVERNRFTEPRFRQFIRVSRFGRSNEIL